MEVITTSCAGQLGLDSNRIFDMKPSSILSALALSSISLTSSFADSVTFKCSFNGLVPQTLVYVINSEAKNAAVIGDFGTHEAFVLSYNEGFFYIIEPNVGASVATILYLHADETPIGVRITLGRISDDQYAGIPDELKLSSENLRFMTVAGRGRCPVQR
jgi:hypothetical protein